MKHKFLFLLVLLLFSSITYGSKMGVTPPSIDYISDGTPEYRGKFTVLPYQAKNMRITFTGQISEYMTFADGSKEIEMYMKSPTTIEYIFRPPTGMTPGDHRAMILAQQYLSPEEKIAQGSGSFAIASIAFVVKYRVPNEGKFLEATLTTKPPRANIGETVFFTLDMLNLGTEDLTNIRSSLTITDGGGNLVEEKVLDTVELLRTADYTKRMSFFETKGRSPGHYLVQSKIDYGNPDIVVAPAAEFRIGDILLKILNITADLTGDIGKFGIHIESNWNDEIENVYAEILIKQGDLVIDTIKTSPVTLPPWGDDWLTGFWEKGDLEAGDYDAEIFVYYYDKYARDQVRVSLDDLKARGSDDLTIRLSPMTLVGAGVVLLLLVNFLWLFKLSKKKKK